MTTTYPSAVSPRYALDGIATTFSTGFNFSPDDAVQVRYIDASGNYTTVADSYSLVNGLTAPTCIFDVAPLAANGTLIFLLVPNVLQTLDLADEGQFLASDIGNAFDQSAKRDLRLQAQINASVRTSPGDVMSVLPPAAARAGKALVFDATTGDATVATLNFVVTTPSGVVMFSSLLGAASSTIPAAPYIATAGYYYAGDGGGALYTAASAGAGAGKFQSADGQWWSIVVPQSGVEARALGAVGDGVTDDAAAIASADALAHHSLTTLHFGPGHYILGSSYTFTSHVSFAAGATLYPQSGVTATFSRSIAAGLWQIFNRAAGGSIVASALYNQIGLVEWLSGVSGDNTKDNHVAIGDCTAIFPVTLLQSATYYCNSPPTITTSGATLAGPVIPGASGATAIICIQSAVNDGLRLGPAADPGSIASMPVNINVERVAVTRSQAVTPPGVGSESGAPSGIRVRYVNGWSIRDCYMGNNYGHSIGVNVANSLCGKIILSKFYRGAVGTVGTNDISWPIGLFGVGPYYIQDLTIEDCSGSLGYAYAGTGTFVGISGSGSIADVKIVNNRFPGYQYGVLINSAGEAIPNTDVEISGNRFDSCAIDGILYENSSTASTARILNNFIRMVTGGGSADAAVSVISNGGVVVLAGNESYGNGSTAIGLKANAAKVVDRDSVWTDFVKPVQITTAVNCVVGSVCRQTAQVVTGASVDILGTGTANRITPTICGDANGLSPIGVRLSAATRKTEVSMTGIDAACLPGGASATKLYLTGTGNITAVGVFNTDNYASGVVA